MAATGAARTVLELRIRQRRLSFDEFAEQLEVFARENGEVGTLSSRHTQRLCAGKLTSNQLRPATVRLLEKFFESSVEELLSAPEVSVSSVERISQKWPRSNSALAVTRKRLGYSQESFAQEIGVELSTVGRWERGTQQPQPWMRPKIAKVLGITVDQVADLIETSSEMEDEVDRREFMGVTAGTALSMRTTFRPTLSSRAGEIDWRHLVDRTARLRRLDNYLGGRDTYSLYASELSSTIEYVRGVS